MGHYIPVFFFPVGESEIPQPLESWEEAEELIASRMDDEGAIYQTTSRNWWHQGLLLDLAKHWSLPGLDFLLASAAALRGPSLDTAETSLAVILEKLETGEVTDLASPDASVFEDPRWRDAFRKAEPELDSSADVDFGFEATLAFFSWVKSLTKVVREARATGNCALLVQPQP